MQAAPFPQEKALPVPGKGSNADGTAAGSAQLDELQLFLLHLGFSLPVAHYCVSFTSLFKVTSSLFQKSVQLPVIL